MIHTVNRKIEMNKELRSKIEWACSFVNKVPKIIERKFENNRTHKFSLCRTTCSNY